MNVNNSKITAGIHLPQAGPAASSEAITKVAELWDYEGNNAIVYRIPGDSSATPL